MAEPTLKDVLAALAALDKRMATKDDLKSMATKDDLKSMATKDDLKSMATKDDLNSVRTELIAKIATARVELRDELVAHIQSVGDDGAIRDLEKRVEKVERAIQKPKRAAAPRAPRGR